MMMVMIKLLIRCQMDDCEVHVPSTLFIWKKIAAYADAYDVAYDDCANDADDDDYW